MVSEPLIYYTPIELGGFGLSLREMTFALGIRPILISTSQLLFYPALVRRYGTDKILRIGCLLWCCVPLSYIALGSAISAYRLPKGFTYLGIACIYAILSFTNPIVPASIQLVVDSTPHQDHLSTLTTIMEYSNTLASGLGAFMGSTVFRLSIEHQWLYGRAFYVFLAIYVLVVAVCVRIALPSGHI
jgi:Na+/melibiose symporter-like transporter